MIIVKIENLVKHYKVSHQTICALNGISLSINQGEFVTITGHSGSGKTTLLNIIGGLDRDYSGNVEVSGKKLSQLRDTELSRMRNQEIGFVFQSFHLLPRLTVLENVLLPYHFSTLISFEEAKQRAMEALIRVNLREKAYMRPQNLSAGERQRVAISRAIMNRPKILLCDEPTGNLDQDTGNIVMSLLLALNREEGMTLIIATHQDWVSGFANRQIVMENGRIIKGVE